MTLNVNDAKMELLDSYWIGLIYLHIKNISYQKNKYRVKFGEPYCAYSVLNSKIRITPKCEFKRFLAFYTQYVINTRSFIVSKRLKKIITRVSIIITYKGGGSHPPLPLHISTSEFFYPPFSLFCCPCQLRHTQEALYLQVVCLYSRTNQEGLLNHRRCHLSQNHRHCLLLVRNDLHQRFRHLG